jgi:hypothetical protein
LHAFTPDGRYMIVRGRLWRTSNPALEPALRQELVNALMAARRAVQEALKIGDAQALLQARCAVDQAKHGLGERGPPWWTDSEPDLNRRMVATTHYAAWHASLPPVETAHRDVV